jgi:hypothetical protein
MDIDNFKSLMFKKNDMTSMKELSKSLKTDFKLEFSDKTPFVSNK